MRSIGFDPGKHAGWTALELPRAGARANLLGRGILSRGIADGIDHRVEEALELMLRFEIDLVGVEAVDFVVGRKGFGPNMAGHLMRAARLGARIYQVALDHGFAAENVTAELWRRWLVGSPQADNPAIAATMRVRIADGSSRSNNHERDGSGVALFVAERALRRARGLPV